MNRKAIDRAERVYRFLLKLYPERYGRTHGEALLGCFLDLYRHTARRTIRPLFWGRTLVDIICNAILLRLAGRRRSAHPQKGEGRMSTLRQDLAYAWRKGMLRWV